MEPPWSRGRCGTSTRGTEGSCGRSREISQGGAPRDMRMDSLRKAILFTPTEMFICIFLNIFPLPPHGGPVSDLWCCCGCPSQVSAVMSYRTRVAEHSLITPLFCGDMFPCMGEGKDSLTSNFVLTRIVFIFLECQNIPAGKLTFCKFSVTHENLPVSEPMSPALAGRFTTEPPKKPQMKYFLTSSYSGDFSESS